MKKIFAVSLISLTILLMAGPMSAQAQEDPAWQAAFVAAVEAVGLQEAIAAQIQAGVPVAQIMAALFAMPDINPSAAIQAAVMAGADSAGVIAAANNAGVSSAVTSAAVNAAQTGQPLAFTPAPPVAPPRGPRINLPPTVVPPPVGTISKSAP